MVHFLIKWHSGNSYDKEFHRRHVPIISDADVVYPDKAMITREMIRNAKKVKLFQYGAGYDTLNIEKPLYIAKELQSIF